MTGELIFSRTVVYVHARVDAKLVFSRVEEIDGRSYGWKMILRMSSWPHNNMCIAVARLFSDTSECKVFDNKWRGCRTAGESRNARGISCGHWLQGRAKFFRGWNIVFQNEAWVLLKYSKYSFVYIVHKVICFVLFFNKKSSSIVFCWNVI